MTSYTAVLILTSAVTLLTHYPSISADALPSGPAPAPVLQISLYVDPAELARTTLPKFRVEFRNGDANDLILNLGFMIANGKQQYAKNVTLTLTDPQGKSQGLELRGPGLIAGRVDPFVLPLPSGATFSLPVDLDKYIASATGDYPIRLKPGAYSLQARYTGEGVPPDQANLDMKGIALMPYWEGTTDSNRQQFEVRDR